MCGTDHDHDHDHHHDHHHDHACCSPGEDYERNLAEQRKHPLTRRQVLQSMGAAGLLITGGGISAGSAYATDPRTGAALPQSRPYAPQGADEFDGFFYLSGDHHIHTRYSPDGKYAVQRQVAEANYHGLGWMVITDHGGQTHNKISVDLTYPDILRARDAFSNMLVFTGLEWNIPGGEHGTVIVQPTTQEKDQIKQFEAAYDGAIGPNTEQQAIAGLRSLDQVDPKPLFFANHPARRGLDSPHEIRNWNSAAPDVACGFEGAPGHQAAGLIRDAEGKFVAYRGFYGSAPNAQSFPGYPTASYFTYGGFDWMTATLGGLWDSLLGDGRRWWITANSDSHGFFSDLQDVDRQQYNTVGYVSEADRYFLRPTYGDFRPGEYSRTYVVADEPSYAAVMAALRAGRSFVVHGDLIDRMKFTASVVGKRDAQASNAPAQQALPYKVFLPLATTPTSQAAGIGGTLTARRGDTVDVVVSVRVPNAPNWNNQRPMVDHIDLITGDINNPGQTADPDTFANPSTRVAQTFGRGDWSQRDTAEGLILSMSFSFPNVERDFYVRLRGTNTNDRGATPALDPDQRGQTGPGESPWDDLWFYSNPIFVQIQS